MVVDVHTHFLPGELITAEGSDHGDVTYRVRVRADDDRVLLDERGVANGFELAQLHDPDRRIADMRELGVDVQVLSVPPPFGFVYERPDPDAAAEICRVLNDGLARTVRDHPRSFIGLATVALQQPERAAAELRRAVTELGLAGVEIGSHVAGRNLDDPQLDVFWAEVERLDATVFIHSTRTLGADRLARYHLRNAIGNPTEDALAVASLIFGGVLDRFARLRVYVAHAGGSCPFLVGRWDRAWQVRREATQHGCARPSSYLRRIGFDSLTHDPDALGHLVRTVGSDNVLLGSDYPYDMADPDPAGSVRAAAALTDEQRAAVLGGNAERWFADQIDGAVRASS
jgi:aminocarboxymuconate-semialdehyde decarboxylase